MVVGSVRKGVSQAKFNEDAANVIYGEVLIFSAVMGLSFSNWYVFGAMIIGMIICIHIPIVNIIMSLFLSFLWAVIGAVITRAFQDVNFDDVTGPWGFLFEILRIIGNAFDELKNEFNRIPDLPIGNVMEMMNFLGGVFSTPASIVVGGILCLCGLGFHLAAIEWSRDITDSEDRNV